MARPLQLSDIWDAYVAGAKDFKTYTPPDDESIDSSADGYVKLLAKYLEEGDNGRPREGGWYRERER